jgi:hypothetical protein
LRWPRAIQQYTALSVIASRAALWATVSSAGASVAGGRNPVRKTKPAYRRHIERSPGPVFKPAALSAVINALSCWSRWCLTKSMARLAVRRVTVAGAGRRTRSWSVAPERQWMPMRTSSLAAFEISVTSPTSVRRRRLRSLFEVVGAAHKRGRSVASASSSARGGGAPPPRASPPRRPRPPPRPRARPPSAVRDCAPRGGSRAHSGERPAPPAPRHSAPAPPGVRALACSAPADP